MLQKIESSVFQGGGPIKILYPGLVTDKRDTGIGSIGRIDHPEVHVNTIIKMHPHINDDILSYFRTGEAEHKDSEGIEKTIGKNVLMLMKAGKSFFHEEKILGANEPFEGLQIFIRPGKKDLKPEVVFMDLESIHSENNWRLLASPSQETAFQFSSQTWIYDTKLINSSITIPKPDKRDLKYILYVFKGNAMVNDGINLTKKEGLIIKNEDIRISTDSEAELVLFVTDESSEYFSEGMYSGNQMY